MNAIYCILQAGCAWCAGIDRTRRILRDLLEVPISTGTINNITRQFASLTGEIIAEIKKKLLESPTLNVDETGSRVGGRPTGAVPIEEMLRG